MKIAVVVPTIRYDRITKFLYEWKEGLALADWYIIEDNPTRTFDLSAFPSVKHFSHKEIDAAPGGWIFSKRSTAIGAFGFLRAYQQDAEIIIMLHDDCHPTATPQDFFFGHRDALRGKTEEPSWVNTMNGLQMRGMPYLNTMRSWKVMLNHGLWEGHPDLDAPTQLLTLRYRSEPTFQSSPLLQTIPVGKYYPMSNMNIAFHRDLTPAMFMLPMGEGQEFSRFEDIWCGVLSKKICDHLGYAVTSGEPLIHHDRASNVWRNLVLEAPGIEVNEYFWEFVDNLVLTKTTIKDCYIEIASKLSMDEYESEYWEHARRRMLVWAEYF